MNGAYYSGATVRFGKEKASGRDCYLVLEELFCRFV